MVSLRFYFPLKMAFLSHRDLWTISILQVKIMRVQVTFQLAYLEIASTDCAVRPVDSVMSCQAGAIRAKLV